MGSVGIAQSENFEKVLLMNDDAKCVELPPMFSWLSTQIDGYPDTVNLKMHACIQEVGTRPVFELETTDHPLISGVSSRHNAGTRPRDHEALASTETPM